MNSGSDFPSPWSIKLRHLLTLSDVEKLSIYILNISFFKSVENKYLLLDRYI